MQRASVAKQAEVTAHTSTMMSFGPQMLMRCISAGGPVQNHAGGHALAALVLYTTINGVVKILVPVSKQSVLPRAASPVFASRGSSPRSPYDATSPPDISPDGWRRCFVCKGLWRGSMANKYWTITFDPADGSLTLTWGSLDNANTNRLELVFGAEHAAAASHLGNKRLTRKLVPPKSKKPYVEVSAGIEREQLPSGACSSTCKRTGSSSTSSAACSGAGPAAASPAAPPAAPAASAAAPPAPAAAAAAPAAAAAAPAPAAARRSSRTSAGQPAERLGFEEPSSIDYESESTDGESDGYDDSDDEDDASTDAP